MICKKNNDTFWCSSFNDITDRSKKECVIGNTEIHKRGDSPVFDFFPLVPPMKWRKYKLFK